MKYKFKNKIVTLSYDRKNGDLLVMDEKGEKIIDKYERCALECIQKFVVQFSGFEFTKCNKLGQKQYKYVELFFIAQSGVVL